MNYQDAFFTLDAGRDAEVVLSVRAGGVRAGVAAVALSHLAERRVVVAVRAEHVALPLDAGSEVE